MSPDMTMIDSSTIEAIGYDEPARELHVRFKSGKTYVYLDVSAETYQEFAQSDSKGSYLNREIKSNFEWREE
jgi:hypothetical protein